WIVPREYRIKPARSEGCRDTFEVRCAVGQVLAQGIHQRSRTPDEHAAVPEIISRIDEFLGALRIRFFCKAMHPKHTTAYAASGLDIAVTGLRPRWLDPHYDDVFARRSNRYCLLHRAAKT